jgi:hypothetical protein
VLEDCGEEESDARRNSTETTNFRFLNHALQNRFTTHHHPTPTIVVTPFVSASISQCSLTNVANLARGSFSAPTAYSPKVKNPASLRIC